MFHIHYYLLEFCRDLFFPPSFIMSFFVGGCARRILGMVRRYGRCAGHGDRQLPLRGRSFQTNYLKVGYHTESRWQHQPASFSSAFKLSGTACLVGWGLGVGVSHLRLETCNEKGQYLSLPSPPVALSYHTSTGSLDPFY